MDRRKFFKLAALAGLGVATPGYVFARNRPGTLWLPPPTTKIEPYAGTLLITIHCGGGWDPTSLCDPKGYPSNMSFEDAQNDGTVMNKSFSAGEIATAGNISYAPLNDGNADAPYQFSTFFEKHYDKLLVINGVDMLTNGHDGGTRHMCCGRLSEGYPALAALHSAVQGKTLPMTFMSFGAYDETMGIVARTRSGNTNALARIAYPDRYDTAEPAATFHSAAAVEMIKAAQEERYNKLKQTELLPRTQQALDLMWSGRSGADELKKLTEYLPDPLSNNSFERQVQVAIAAYKAGICTSAQLTTGGHDTHGNHDQNQIPRLANDIRGMDFVFEEAQRQGVWGKVVVMMGSDFGRTPGYNDGNGKDHWPITSVMLMGAGIKGNRVVGASDERHNALGVNPSTLAVDDANGIHIEPKHIHANLRQVLGITDAEMSRMFPINIADDETMNLFS